jgi:hypothetical protein
LKLKTLTSTDNRLQKVLDYIKSIDFNKGKYKNSKGIFYGDYKTDDIYLYIDDNTNEEEIRDLLLNIVKKWWPNFESGIEFHTYVVEDYFIEVKQMKNDKNAWEFIAEAVDDSVYFKFNTNFVVKL